MDVKTKATDEATETAEVEEIDEDEQIDTEVHFPLTPSKKTFH